MANLIKTTITLPEDLFRAAKIRAVEEKQSLSTLVREGLEKRIKQVSKNSVKKQDPLRHLGVFKLGIKTPYVHRSDLYEEHLKRKMGY